MKIAVTYEDGQIFQHFGHTKQFKIYDTADGKVTQAAVVDTDGAGHSALAEFLQKAGVSALICGGIGGGARTALEGLGIVIYGGVAGEADRAVEALLAGNLQYDPEVRCAHHDHEHGHDHECCGHGHGECHGDHEHGHGGCHGGHGHGHGDDGCCCHN